MWTRYRILAATIIAVGLASAAIVAVLLRPTPVWRTAFVKRGWSGSFPASSAGGIGATIRNPATLAFSGSKVRVILGSDSHSDTALSKLTIAPAASQPGMLAGAPTEITFSGAPGVFIPVRSADIRSDEATARINSGAWFVQESFSSQAYPFAYYSYNPSYEPGDHHRRDSLPATREGMWLGNAYRVDVLTTDTRPLIVCYGDSITQGDRSTPGSGRSYPDQLSKRLGLPVLNLGLSGDVITRRQNSAQEIRALAGVDVVVYLMGVNDIIHDKTKSAAEYERCAAVIIRQLHQGGIKVYWGTIPPFNGFRGVMLAGSNTENPDKEALRMKINSWIRSSSGANGVIDFDKALADPAEPSKLRADCQSDWLHPNDEGYRRMAEAAAAVLH